VNIDGPKMQPKKSPDLSFVFVFRKWVRKNRNLCPCSENADKNHSQFVNSVLNIDGPKIRKKNYPELYIVCVLGKCGENHFRFVHSVLSISGPKIHPKKSPDL
jgi:hypothetical protein